MAKKISVQEKERREGLAEAALTRCAHCLYDDGLICLNCLGNELAIAEQVGCKQARAEVLAAVLKHLRRDIRWQKNECGVEGEQSAWIDGYEKALYEAAKEIEQLQPDAAALEEYVKNLPLSEIARIKGIPGIAKLGKAYDRPDFTCVEDE